MNNQPIWQPSQSRAAQSNMAQFMMLIEEKYAKKFASYHALHTWSIENLALFWQTLCDYLQIQFNTPPKQILNATQPMIDAHWFEGATFNFAEKLLSRDDEHPAIIARDESGYREVLSFHALRQAVAACAASLKQTGVQPGMRVAGILCNNTYPIIAMLATTSLGAIWSSCSPDFGSDAIIDRFGQIEPTVIFICNAYRYQQQIYDMRDKITALCQALPKLKTCVICPSNSIYLENYQNISKINITWENFITPGTTLSFPAFPFNHPLYILFSSGTTGKPKCIVHGAGGTLLQHLKELSLHTDLSAHDRLLFYTTCGWMMWHWMASALALGTTLVLFDGAPISAHTDRLFTCVDQEHINIFGTSAKYLSTLQSLHITPKDNLALQQLRCILSTGSPLMPQQYDFVKTKISPDVQLASISGGTDIISCFALGNPIAPVYRGELQCLGLGMAVKIFNEQGQSVHQTRGELVCTQPFPSMPIGFWHDPEKIKYKQTYFERFPEIWTHGDFAEITEHDGLIIHGRSDATLNAGGIRIGSAEIYQQLKKIPEILDSVAIGQDWQQDTRIILFVTLNTSYHLDQALQNKIRHTIRTHTSPRHVPAKIIAVPDIPRTFNGKTVETAVRQAVHGQDVLPSQLNAIVNPEALDYFRNIDELKF